MWDPGPASGGVSSYEVCLGTSSLSCNVRLTTVSASETSFPFSPTPGIRQYVAVRAVSGSSRSSYTAEQSFSIPKISQLSNRSTSVSVAISPFTVGVTDPDGSSLIFTHTGLPLGLTLSQSTGRISGTPTTAGTYSVTVFVNDGLVTVSQSFVWTITGSSTPDTSSPTLTITSHASGLVVTSAAQTIRGTATDSGRGGHGIASVRVNGQLASGATASSNNTANWSKALALSAGNNTITVEATDGSGNTQMYQITVMLSLPAAATAPLQAAGPLALTGLTSDRTSPQAAGTAITFTAVATGGRSPYQYKWWLFDGTTWIVLQDWSANAVRTWTPTQAGSGYQIGVWVRDSTMTSNIGTYVRSMPFTISGKAAALSALSVTGLNANRVSPQPAGTPIRFTASVSGGSSPYQYKWWLFDGTAWTMVRNWSADATYTWTPTQAGSAYQIGVWVRDSTMTSNVGTYHRSMSFAVSGSSLPAPSQLAVTALGANRVSPQPVGTAITFTASASGGRAPYQYKWWLFDGTVWIIARDWNSSATYTWTPTRAGSAYQIGVWVRDSTMTSNVGTYVRSLPFAVSGTSTSVGPLMTTITSNLPSPQRAGTSVTFTARATGGLPAYQYKWWVFNGTEWIVARDWSTSNAYTWTALPRGSNYFVGVWVRDSTTNANVGDVYYSVAFATQ
jgi:large repetitive protein